MKYTYLTSSPEETIALGEKLGKLLHAGDFIVYCGDLGAGKTTMTRGIALGMGLGDCVSSPTYTIVNEYPGKLRLCHFDMYRITDDGVEATGFEDYSLKNSVFAVEWSENIPSYIPEQRITINLAHKGESEREITIEGDERFADLGN